MTTAGRRSPLALSVVLGLALTVLGSMGLPPRAAGAAAEVPGLSEAARALLDEHPLRVGWFRGAPPVSLWDGDEVTGGYAVEQWNLMAIKLGIEVEHVVFDDIPAVVEALRDGTIDVAGTQGARPDLLEFAGSTEPLAWERIAFVGAEGLVGLDLGSLAGRTVTTVAGSPMEATLADFPEATYVVTDTIGEGLRRVADQEIDLYLAPLAVVGFARVNEGLSLAPVGEAVQIIPLSAWAPLDSPALEVARAARATLTDEEISLITVRFTGFDLGRPRTSSTPGWLLPALGVVAGLTLVFAAFVVVLRRRVRRATLALTEANSELAALNQDLEARVEARTRQLDEAADRLRESNTALTQFARTTAHDLRGPVSAIHGLSSLLGSDDFTQEEKQEIAQRIESSSRRLGELISSMLEDATSRQTGEPELDGPQFAAWLRDVMAVQLQESGIEMQVRTPPDVIPVDPSLLRSCAVNLVGNAVKYAVSEDGTRIEVSLYATSPTTWRLEVDDNGPGIPEEHRELVFQRGYQVQDDQRGAGLGLAEVHDHVQRVGGTVEVTSSPMGGARVSVGLPAAG